MAVDNEKMELDLKLKHLSRFKEKYDQEIAGEYAKDSDALKGVKVNDAALAASDGVVNIAVATGTQDGTLKVNGSDVAVAGLAAMAYKASVSADDLDNSLKDAVDSIGDKAEASDLSTLVGEDTGKAARAIAAEEAAKEVAKVVASAPGDFDTLKEIADWIANDQTGAAKMSNDISALATKATLGEDGEGHEYATVKAYVEAVTAGFISLSGISSETTGAGNAVTSVDYSPSDGSISVVKGATYLTESEVDARIDAKVKYAELSDVDALFE